MYVGLVNSWRRYPSGWSEFFRNGAEETRCRAAETSNKIEKKSRALHLRGARDAHRFILYYYLVVEFFLLNHQNTCRRLG